MKHGRVAMIVTASVTPQSLKLPGYQSPSANLKFDVPASIAAIG